MLIQFNFNNFKSFKNDISLDMTATNIKEHEYNLISDRRNEKFLKVAAIYGANASGKSSVIQAFDFMADWVLSSFKKASDKNGIPIKSFGFDKDNRTSEFEVFFRYREKEYQYGFKIDNKKVHEEWLYKRNFRLKEKYDMLFERVNGKIECNKILKGANNFIAMVEESTLFLSIISNAKIPYAKDVFDWFAETCIIDYGDVKFEHFINMRLPTWIESEDYQKEVVKFLKAIDISIDGIRVEKNKEENSNKKYTIYSKHYNKNEDKMYEINFNEESNGTQKIFALYNYLKAALNLGIIMFIDELDAKLHPLLLRYIITLFHNEKLNKKGAQLIYTTHDNYTLSRDIFRRDQIWFTEKNDEGISNLYSLAEYKLENNKKTRNDASYNKDYILGKYGAVPILRGFDMWEEENE